MQGCEWNDSTVGTGVQLGVAWVPAFRHGLADIYPQRRTAAYWQPVTEGGYPAVLNDTVDERGTGTCRMDLGVSNTACSICLIRTLLQPTHAAKSRRWP